MTQRTIAIGDMHGYSAALAAILEAIAPQPDDRLVLMGDYVDRGPDSRGVLDQLLALEPRCRLIPLLGNHEEMLLMAAADPMAFASWSIYGGAATLQSYGADTVEQIPAEHLDFMRRCVLHFETDTHLFVHANYEPDLPLDRQPREILLWLSLRECVPGPHCSGKIAIVGHTPQDDGRILDVGHLKCIDTGCYRGGPLTALDVDRGTIWQADQQGRLIT